ncbi:GNAT family N-acetyltransferase [Paenibacillus tarimensis]
MDSVVIRNLNDEAILQIIEMDCSPLPNERDSIYLNFYRFFRDTCWVAVLEDKVIGFALGMLDQTDPTHCYLNYLFVKSEHRKTGLGHRLLKQFEISARQKGCKIVTLLTAKTENIGYYNKQGYEKNHDLKHFREDDAVYDYYYNRKKVSLLIKVL